MKNVTITLDEEVARWARLRAAELETSVSRLVGEMLREKMTLARGYRAARKQFSAVVPRRLRDPGRPFPSREELHGRADLR